ncbi:MAG: phosphoribosylformylglycinamidine synthase subunit PurS [Deinococcota bacterium]|jgi:phosphoribosylformylglycinamidine synthase|nr:phosphoribosylformylglycinamidine synthase subunit PurS [Deinococcota bacterium]
MPEYKAEVHVMLRRSILDPQGRAVETTLKRLGHHNVENLRVGKVIELTLRGERAEVERQLEEISTKVLSNPVMEDVTFSVNEVKPEAA